MRMKNKKALPGIVAVAVIAVVAVVSIRFMGSGLEHIEDTNGADNYALAVITDGQIIDKSTGALNVVTKTGLNGIVTVSSDRFSGVYEVLYNNYIGPYDFVLQLHSFTVSSGNFEMCIVHGDEIVAVIEPGQPVNYLLEDISGRVSLVIAGESAEFSFSMAASDYDGFAHD